MLNYEQVKFFDLDSDDDRVSRDLDFDLFICEFLLIINLKKLRNRGQVGILLDTSVLADLFDKDMFEPVFSVFVVPSFCGSTEESIR